MKKLLGISTAIMLSPLVAEAAPQTFKDLIDRIIVMTDLIVPILVGAALVLYLFGVSQGVLKAGEEKNRHEMVKNFYTWGLIILFVMVSIWGILRLMMATFFSSEGAGGGAYYGEVIDVGSDNYFDCGFGEC